VATGHVQSELTLADAALDAGARLGAEQIQFRLARTDRTDTRLRDGSPDGGGDSEDVGIGVRVLLDGGWGYAGSAALDPVGAAAAVRDAAEAARLTRRLRREPVRPVAEPGHGTVSWTSPYLLDPFEIAPAERISALAEWTEWVHEAGPVDHVLAKVQAQREDIFYADSTGTTARQRRIWIHPMLTAIRRDPQLGFEFQRTLGPPTARGWEYVTGAGWDWRDELARLPDRLADAIAAPEVEPGAYDLVIDPTNLWLTIHETVGHATELDRMLGHEADYAGTSFASVSDLGSLRYGSAAMNVTADRTARYGLASTGYDDEGVAAGRWDLVRDGILVGVQTDRASAPAAGLPRSNGCSYAESWQHVPVPRMANVSLQPDPVGPNTEELIGRVRDGIYVVGDRSWSIDMQRYNFQFTGQRFYRIRDGRITGPVRDAAYQGSTLDFWRSLEAVGGPDSYLLSGASRCGKAQPLQLAAAGHGCPSALFRGVRVLNTRQAIS
jgi:TldD protein